MWFLCTGGGLILKRLRKHFRVIKMFLILTFWSLHNCFHVLWTEVCISPNFLCWHLIQNVILFGGGDIQRSSGYECRALMNEISDLMKKAPEISIVPSSMWGYNMKMDFYKSGSKSLPNTESVSILFLAF